MHKSVAARLCMLLTSVLTVHASQAAQPQCEIVEQVVYGDAYGGILGPDNGAFWKPDGVRPPPTTTLTAIHSASPISYSGPELDGWNNLPPYMQNALTPKKRPCPAYPGYGSGKLGNNALSQGQQNGDSPLGTTTAPRCPPYVGSSESGADTWGAPWGDNVTADGTNPYKECPTTGQVRKYDWTVSRAVMAPDGVEKHVLVINNAFPGPMIEANWGDMIEVTVHNAITGPEEGFAIHWHGLLQTYTNCEDGIPGITQCPIAPGQTHVYRFQADLYGTSWWHSHYSAQYAGGAFGAMIVHGPKSCDYDVDLGPVLLSDWYHDDYYSVLEVVMGRDPSKVAVFSQNNLINGKNNFDCKTVKSNSTKCTPNAGLSKFKFESGKKHRLRLINSGSEGLQRFSIDEHELEVMQYDFVPIQSYKTNSVTLDIGQRADVIVHATGKPGSSYWMRSNISTTCSLADQPAALAIIYYEDADTTSEPTSTAHIIDDTTCANDALTKTVPFFPLKPPQSEATIEVDVNFIVNGSGNFLWTMNKSSFRTDYNRPILSEIQATNYTSAIDTFPSEWNVYNFGSNKSFTIVVNNGFFVAHPMHIHGHNMFVLSSGPGKWDGTIQGDPNNPARRDVQILEPNGHIALQIEADNPGVWPFHCHIAWHVSAGLYINILERPDDIHTQLKDPGKMKDLCTAWNAYTSRQAPDQIDSGLRKRINKADPVRHQEYKKHTHGHVRHSV